MENGRIAFILSCAAAVFLSGVLAGCNPILSEEDYYRALYSKVSVSTLTDKCNNTLGVALDGSGNVYVADGTANQIEKVSPDGAFSVLAGSGEKRDRDGVGMAAAFNGPHDIAVNAAGVIYVCTDYGLRRISPEGAVTTVGNYSNIYRLCADCSGNVYFFGGASRIYKIAANGSVALYMDNSSGIIGIQNDVAADPSGQVYALCSNSVYSIAADGSPTLVINVDSLGYRLRSIAVDGKGRIYATADSSHEIYKIFPDSRSVVHYAGMDLSGYCDGGCAEARFMNPRDLAVDASGSVFVADSERIRKIQ